LTVDSRSESVNVSRPAEVKDILKFCPRMSIVRGFFNEILFSFMKEVDILPSGKILEQKKLVVEEITKKLQSAKGMVFADYRGLTVGQDTELRNAFRKAGVEYQVVKNTLTTFAAKSLGLDMLAGVLHGPTALAYSDIDPVAPAKVTVEFQKKFEKFTVKAGVVEGKIIDENGVKALAELPSKEVLLGQVVGTLNAPITGFVTVLNGNLKGLVVALNAIAEKRANA
jgi:large subunit ribosomal protein L10